MDIVSKKKRSRMMAAIKSENTKPEKAIRSSLYRMGYRYRLHVRGLPGTPDIVLPQYGTVIFVNGCFWHSHDCSRATTPKTNKKFWIDKFEKNKERDKRNKAALEDTGWEVVVVWECELINDINEVVERVDGILKKRNNKRIKLEIKKNEFRKKKKRTKSPGVRSGRRTETKRGRKNTCSR